MESRKRKIPSIYWSCKFEGVQLKRHLSSKPHNLPEKESALAELFMNQKIKHICLVDKHGIPKPGICQECHTCNSQINVHLNHTNQISRGSEKKGIKNHKHWKEQEKTNPKILNWIGHE